MLSLRAARLPPCSRHSSP